LFIVTPSRRSARADRGFSLIEVMVALTVTSLGLLGLAKMESLALMSTNVSGSRALAALQASSLAAAMHADSDYWAYTAPPLTTVDATVANNFAAAALAKPCTTAGTTACNSAQMATYDLYKWGLALSYLLPGYQGLITCTTTTPMACTIKITWTENAIANNANQSQSLLANLAEPVYSMDVQP
jgi:type IV pilus assembly protein PilV